MSDIDPSSAIHSADGYLYRTPSEHVQGSPQYDHLGHEVRFGGDADPDTIDLMSGTDSGAFDITEPPDDGGLLSDLITGIVSLFS